MTAGRDTGDVRYDHMMLGVVTDNQDPLRIGRVRVLVDGILDPESRWAFPIGFMHGIKNGIFWVPEVGAQVVVWLNQGDQDHPYYQAGPFGAPDGVSDVPEQVPQGSPDVMSIRWRGFHITFDGRSGAEKLTFEDLDSGTKLEIDKTTGDYLSDVEGSEVVEVKTDRDVTVEEGDETHTVTLGDETHTVAAGKRTTSIEGDDDKTVVSGDDKTTITAGSEVKTISAGGSTESMPLGVKLITALTINLIASGAIGITATGAVVLTGASVALMAAINQLGTGGFKKLATEDFVNNVYNAHVHSGVLAGGASTGVPSVLGTPAELTSETTAS